MHCANPGAMTGLAAPGARILLSDSGNPNRKLRFTWELVRVGRVYACVNTAVANRVVAHWLGTGRLFPEYAAVRREPRGGASRFDFLLEGAGRPPCLLEVKTVTLRRGVVGAFPDAVTARGRRHVEELAAVRGLRRVLLFFVARADIAHVEPADDIDPAYAAALRAAAAGVEIRAVRARFTRRGATWDGDVPVRLES